jgi:MFS family permease
VTSASWSRWGALGVPNYRTYFLGTAVSQSSAWLLRTAQAWIVLDLTGSSAALGVLAFAQFLPVTVLTLFAGVLIDRAASGTLVIFSQILIACQATVMAALVLSQRVEYWQILALATLLGVANAFDTPARASLANQLVGPGRVGNAIALNSALQNGARIVGPGVGGVMIALWGNGVCFAVAAAMSFVALGALLLLRPEQFYPKRNAEHGRLLSQLRDGLAYAFGNPSIGFNIVLMAFIGTFAYNWGVTLPILARYALDGGSEGFGALNVAMGLGSVLGGLLLAVWLKPSTLMVLVSACLYATSLFALGYAPNMPTAMAQLLVVGVLSIVYSASANIILQIEARDEFRGRVLGLFMLLWAGTTPFGSAFTGFVSDLWDIRVALHVNGAMCLIGVVVACAYLVLARRVRSSRVVQA